MAKQPRWGGEKSSPQPEKRETKMPTEIDIDALMKKDVDALTPEELKIRLRNTEAKIAGMKLDTSMHTDGRSIDELGPDDIVSITVPSSPMGEPYNLNFNYFTPGTYQVKKRVALDLSYRISQSWKTERERLISRTNKFAGAILRGEELAKINRFEEIMKN
jgi:hypothetical protein